MIQELKINEHVTEEIDFDSLERESFIDVEKPIQHPPIAISIGEHIYKGNYYPTPYGSYGDYSCIVGASKSRKTFLTSMLTSCYIGGNSTYYAENIKGHDTEGKYILHFDTEQSPYHSQRVARRVNEMVGQIYPGYKPFSLREYSPDTRFAFIEYMLYKSQYAGKIGLVIIDGIVDLVQDFNNLQQCTIVTNKFLEWTTKTGCHLIGILHKNFGSDKPTGHIGSTILKKAETVVYLDHNEESENVQVTPRYTRNVPFEKFEFNVDENWLPYVIKSMF